MSDDFWQTEEITMVDVSVDLNTTADEVTILNETVNVTVDSTPEYVIVESNPVVGAVAIPQQRISDLISSIEAYIGYANPDASTSDAAWSICHVQDTDDGPRITWAASTSGSYYDLIWDARFTYTFPGVEAADFALYDSLSTTYDSMTVTYDSAGP